MVAWLISIVITPLAWGVPLQEEGPKLNNPKAEAIWRARSRVLKRTAFDRLERRSKRPVNPLGDMHADWIWYEAPARPRGPVSRFVAEAYADRLAASFEESRAGANGVIDPAFLFEKPILIRVMTMLDEEVIKTIQHSKGMLLREAIREAERRQLDRTQALIAAANRLALDGTAPDSESLIRALYGTKKRTAWPGLRAMSTNRNPFIRDLAAVAGGQLGDRNMIKALWAATSRRDRFGTSTTRMAARILIDMNEGVTVAELRRMLKTVLQRRYLFAPLAQREDAPGRRYLAELASDPKEDRLERLWALRALINVDDPLAVRAARIMQRDASKNVTADGYFAETELRTKPRCRAAMGLPPKNSIRAEGGED